MQDKIKRARNIKEIRENRLKREKAAFMKLGAKIKAYFFTGILVTAPVAITFYMAYKLIFFIDRFVSKLIPPRFSPDQYLPFTIPGLGVIVLVAAMIFVGMFAAGFVGKIMIRLGEWIVYKVPFISSVYSLFKQIFETFFSNKNRSFEKAVLLEYPREGLWVIGFVSSKTKGEVQKKLEGEMLNVFVPTTPNPTSGFLLFVPKEKVIYLDTPVEECLKLVISCGIVEAEEKVSKKIRHKKQ